MIIEIISLAVFAASTSVFLGIILKKMPLPEQLPAKPAENAATAKQQIKDWCKTKAKSLPYLRDFSWLDFAQKILLKVRLVALKAENKINDYMVRLRQVADEERKKDEIRLDNYWRELKTIVKGKYPLYKRNAKTSVVEAETGSDSKPAAALAPAKTKSAPGTNSLKIKNTVVPPVGREAQKFGRRKKTSNIIRKRHPDIFR